MEAVAGVTLSLSFAAAGAWLVWRMHGVVSLLAIGLVLIAVGACGVAAAIMGAGLGTIIGGAVTVGIAIAVLYVLGQSGG